MIGQQKKKKSGGKVIGLLLFVLIVAGSLWFLSTQAKEQPLETIEQEVILNDGDA